MVAFADKVAETGADFAAGATIQARLPLTSANAAAVLDVGRIDDGIDQIQVHALHLELRDAPVEGRALVDAGVQSNFVVVPSSDVEARVEVETARGAGRLTANFSAVVVDNQQAIAEAPIRRDLYPLTGADLLVAPQNGRS